MNRYYKSYQKLELKPEVYEALKTIHKFLQEYPDSAYIKLFQDESWIIGDGDEKFAEDAST